MQAIGWLKSVLRETVGISFDLFKLMIPILLLVKLAEDFGATNILAGWIEPLMSSIGLPPEMGIVWAGAMLSNIYTGMVLFISEPTSAMLSAAQVTSLGLLLLFAHSMPVELRVAQKIAVPLRISLPFRLVAAYLSAWVYFQLGQIFGFGDQQANIIWQAEARPSGWGSWLLANLQLFVQIVLIIALLVVLLRVIRILRLDRLIHFVLRPVLPLIGLSDKAINVALVGITLGLTYGGGMLIQESRQGVLAARELFFSVCLLLVCHGLIEDTLLILLLGADLYGILGLRLLVSFLLLAAMVYGLRHRDEGFFTRYLLNRNYQQL